MRYAATLALLLLVGGCLPYRSSGPGDPRPGNPGNSRGSGVLVQAKGGRCTNVLVAGTPRRVCLPARRRPEAPADTTTTDSVEVTRQSSDGSR